MLLLLMSIPLTAEPIKTVLHNGVTVIIDAYDSPLVEVQYFVKTGAINEGPYMGAGLSHCLEHMLFKGTARRGVGELSKEVEAAGGYFNAYTSSENTVFHITGRAEQFNVYFDVLDDMIRHAALDADELEKEKEVILKEINMNDDDPDRYFSRMLFHAVYHVFPYKHPVLGYRSVFSNISRETLYDYYSKRYIPQNIIIVITGGINTAAVMNAVQKKTESWQPSPQQVSVFPDEPLPAEPKTVVEKRTGIENARHALCWQSCSITDDDLYALDVLANIIGDGKSSTLRRELQTKRGWVHSIEAWNYTPVYRGVFSIEAVLSEKNIKKVDRFIFKTIHKAAAGRIHETDIDRVKKSVAARTWFERETVSGRARDLGASEFHIHALDFSQQYVDGIAAVTKADIKRVARKYLTKKRMITVSLLPTDKKDEVSTSLFDITKTNTVAPIIWNQQPITTNAFAVQAPITNSTAAATAEEPITTLYKLDGGLRVLIREDRSVPVVAVRAVCIGGTIVENESNTGITALMSSMLLEGTTTRNNNDIALMMESIGGTIDHYNGDNSFGITMQCLAADWHVPITLLADILCNATFPTKELPRVKSQLIQSIRETEQQVFPVGRKLLRYNFFGNHPYHLNSYGSIESINALTQNDLLSFYSKYCTRSNTVICVYGDVNAHAIREAVEKSFAAYRSGDNPVLPHREKTPRHIAVETGILSNNNMLHHVQTNIPKQQALILIAYPGVAVDDPQRPAVDVLNALLSGMGSPLFDIRDTHGLAYYIGSFVMTGLHPGAYIFYVGTTPQFVELAQDEIFKVIHATARGDLSSEDVSRGRSGLLGEKLTGLQTMSARAFSDGLNELYGLGYTYNEKYFDRIRSVTKENVIQAAKEIFNDSAALVVFVLPEKPEKSLPQQ